VRQINAGQPRGIEEALMGRRWYSVPASAHSNRWAETFLRLGDEA